jgi:hypothetical protein
MDIPENQPENLTEIPNKKSQNTVKSSKGEIWESKDTLTITPYNTGKLQKVTATHTAWLEPATYELEII